MPIGENTYYPWRIGDYPPYQPVTPWWAQRPCWGHPLPNGVDIDTGANTNAPPTDEALEAWEEELLAAAFEETDGGVPPSLKYWRVWYGAGDSYDVRAETIQFGYLGDNLTSEVTFKIGDEVVATYLHIRGWTLLQDKTALEAAKD